MKIKNISLDDNELPEMVVAELTVDEFALIHVLVGSIRPDQLKETTGFDSGISSDILLWCMSSLQSFLGRRS